MSQERHVVSILKIQIWIGSQKTFKWKTCHTDCVIVTQWHHNGRDGVSSNRRLDCLLNRLFRRRSNKTSKLRVTGLCEGNSPVTGEFPAQRASYAENVSIWWGHHVTDPVTIKQQFINNKITGPWINIKIVSPDTGILTTVLSFKWKFYHGKISWH